jgi:hypothetical protein
MARSQINFLPLLVETAHMDAEIPYIHTGLIAYPTFRFTLFFSTWTPVDDVMMFDFFRLTTA